MVLIMTLTLFTVRVLAAEETTEGGTAGVLDLSEESHPSNPGLYVSGTGMSDARIIDLVVDNMKRLAKVPRPSHHEQEISEYLMDWAKEQGDPKCSRYIHRRTWARKKLISSGCLRISGGFT